MNIVASSICKGDFVVDFGTVSEIRYFFKDQSVKTKTYNPHMKLIIKSKGDYERIVSKEFDCYDSILDNVFVKTSCGKTRTFGPDDVVSVYRVRSVAV